MVLSCKIIDFHKNGWKFRWIKLQEVKICHLDEVFVGLEGGVCYSFFSQHNFDLQKKEQKFRWKKLWEIKICHLDEVFVELEGSVCYTFFSQHNSEVSKVCNIFLGNWIYKCVSYYKY